MTCLMVPFMRFVVTKREHVNEWFPKGAGCVYSCGDDKTQDNAQL